MRPLSLQRLEAAIGQALGSAQNCQVRLGDDELVFTRAELDDDGAVVHLTEETLAGTALQAFDATPERLARWAQAFARFQDTEPPARVRSVVLLSRASLQTTDDFATAMTDDPLISALWKAIDPQRWDGCGTGWARARRAAELGCFVVLEEMLLDEPDLALARGDHGFTLLHHVAERCDEFAAEQYLRCVELLLARGADPNAPNDYGDTPLHLARAEVIEALAAHGAQLEARNDRGQTPLLVQSTEAEGLERMEILLQLGADPHTRDTDGMSPLDYARRRQEHEKVDLLTGEQP